MDDIVDQVCAWEQSTRIESRKKPFKWVRPFLCCCQWNSAHFSSGRFCEFNKPLQYLRIRIGKFHWNWHWEWWTCIIRSRFLIQNAIKWMDSNSFSWHKPYRVGTKGKNEWKKVMLENAFVFTPIHLCHDFNLFSLYRCGWMSGGACIFRFFCACFSVLLHRRLGRLVECFMLGRLACERLLVYEFYINSDSCCSVLTWNSLYHNKM